MILIVDDDASVRTSLELLLKQSGHPSRAASGPSEALESLRSEPFDLVLQDMNFSRDTSGREGLELLRRIRAEHPRLPVILITAWGSIALAVDGIKTGASDFLTKPWTNTHLVQSVETVLSLAGRGTTVAAREVPKRTDLDARHDFLALIGDDPEFLRMLDLIARVAPTDASVLISGDSGTGKELAAEAIHGNSRRRDRPFVKVNLGGISSTLFESEMFGHVRGAFTDARSDRKGRFAVAEGGTIFLDEIGELDANSQVKLLRVLQDRTYEPLGSSATRTVDVRIVSATNRDLAHEVEAGAFREDLLYRLNLISIRLPALRERRADIPELARHFLAQCGAEYGRPGIELTAAAVDWLRVRDWPGNIRQLRQTLERAVLVVDSNRIDAAALETLSELDTRSRRGDELPQPGAMTLDQMERAMIVNCMRHYQGNLTRVARALGLSRAALYRRLEKYRIQES
jgi:DNA-binding NtrC family response regulator